MNAGGLHDIFVQETGTIKKYFFKQIQLYVKKQNKNESDFPGQWQLVLFYFLKIYIQYVCFYIQYVGLFIYNM